MIDTFLKKLVEISVEMAVLDRYLSEGKVFWYWKQLKKPVELNSELEIVLYFEDYCHALLTECPLYVTEETTVSFDFDVF